MSKPMKMWWYFGNHNHTPTSGFLTLCFLFVCFFAAFMSSLLLKLEYTKNVADPWPLFVVLVTDSLCDIWNSAQNDTVTDLYGPLCSGLNNMTCLDILSNMFGCVFEFREHLASTKKVLYTFCNVKQWQKERKNTSIVMPSNKQTSIQFYLAAFLSF